MKKLARAIKQQIVDTICGIRPHLTSSNLHSFNDLERWEKNVRRVKETIKIIELVLGEMLDEG